MSSRKKILFVSARLPYPTLEGHQIRAFGVLSQLAQKHNVHLLSLLREGENIDRSNVLGQTCLSISGVEVAKGLKASFRAGISGILQKQPLVVSKYVTPLLRKEFTRKIEELKPDVVHLDLLPLAGLIDLIPKNIKVVLNEHNIESDLIKQKIKTIDSILLKTIYKREYQKLSEFEVKSCRNVDAVLACSKQDVSCIKGWGVDAVHCIPNGVDVKKLKPDNSNKSPKTLLFLGGMGWYPNRLGMIWFLTEVFPLILKRDPEVKLELVGNPEPAIDIPLECEANVLKLGFVDDFIPYVQKSSVMIVPLNVGSGTRLKVVEGLALGKCMVSTSKGAEGVGLTHGEDILFADTADDFAEQVLSAISSPSSTHLLEINARNLAENIYDWNVIGKNLYSIYESL